MTVAKDNSQIQFMNYLVDSWTPPEMFGTLPPESMTDVQDDLRNNSRKSRQNVVPDANLFWSATNLQSKGGLPMASPDQPQRVSSADSFRTSRKFRYAVGARTPPCTLGLIIGDEAHPDSVDVLDVNKDASMCCAGFSNSKTVVWSLSSERTSGGSVSEMYSSMFTPSSTGSNQFVIPTSRGTTCLKFAPDAPIILSGSSRGDVSLWSVETQQKLVSYTGHSCRTPVWSIDWSPAGYYFSTGSGDSTARVWRTDIPFPIRSFIADGSAHVQLVKWHPSCQLVAIGSTNSLSVQEVGSPNELFRFDDFKNATAIDFSPSGYLMAAANMDRLTVWELRTGAEIFSIDTFKPIVELSWSYPASAGLGDGGLRGLTGMTGAGHPVLASVEQGGKVRLWDKLHIPKTSVCEIAFSQPIRPLHMHFTPRNLLVVAGSKEPCDMSSIQQLGISNPVHMMQE